MLYVDNNFSITQKSYFGKLSLKLSPEELSVLNLYFCEAPKIEHFWNILWGKAMIYDELPFSCKEVMPSIISKVQNYIENNENSTLRLPQYLIGLPKYSWTKNYFILNEFKKLVFILNQNNIEFVAIKGICEIIEGKGYEKFRTTRDIDLLIREHDLLKFRCIIETAGWKIPEKKKKLEYLYSPVITHAETFCSPNFAFSMDIHFRLFHGNKEIGERFAERVWNYKKPSNKFENIFVPSLEHRLIIAFENSNELGNWKNGLFLKYILDFKSLVSLMTESDLKCLQYEIELIPSLKNSFYLALKELSTFKGIIEQEKYDKYLVKLKLNSSYILIVGYVTNLFNLFKLMFNREKALHIMVYILYKVFVVCLIRFPKYVFRFLFSNSNVDKTDRNYHPLIFLSLFKKSI